MQKNSGTHEKHRPPPEGARVSAWREIAICALGLGFFLWLYHGTFSIGFLDEDFAWLAWKEEASLRTLFKPSTQVYYRPLATNVPYFFLSSTAVGVAAWKAIALALACLGAIAIPYSRADARERRIACSLALLWLLAPFQSFSAFYVNAFDYALFPFCTIALCCALKRQRYLFAFLFLAGAILSKEQGLALLLAPLVAGGSRPPRWYWAAAFSLSAAYLLAHGGVSWNQQIAAGFSVSLDPSTVAETAARTLATLFLGAQQGSWGWAWHAVALAALLFTICDLVRSGAGPGLHSIGRALVLVLILVSPFFLLPEVVLTNLGGGSWGILFLTLADATSMLGDKAMRRLDAILLSGSAVCAIFALTSVPPIEKFYLEESDSFRGLLESARPLLESCTPADRVVLEGLTPAFGDPTRAKYAYWAVRSRFRGPRFYLLLSGSARPDFEIAPGETRTWVEPWRAAGHPRVVFARQAKEPGETGPVRVLAHGGSGDPGCGWL